MSNATGVPVADDRIVASFVSSGRSGRRNAMGDILCEGESCADTSQLPGQLDSMSLATTQPNQQGQSIKSKNEASKS